MPNSYKKIREENEGNPIAPAKFIQKMRVKKSKRRWKERKK